MTKSLFSFLLPLFLINSCVTETDTDGPSFKSYNWEISNPTNENLNEGLISEGFSEASNTGYIYSMVIIRNGRLAAEKYFKERTPSSYQTIRSVSKSFLSAFFGIAVQKGILSLDRKLVDYFPEYKQNIIDPRINNVTVDHLIKMRAGFKGDQEFYFTFTNSSDWVKTILSSQLSFDPGSRMQYSTAGTHLLSALLARGCGKSTFDFAKENFFDPCGFDARNWPKDPQGNYFGGNNIYLTTRDMAVLGLIYLNSGKLDGKQIVPVDWVSNSLVTYSGSSTIPWGNLNKVGYGYLWWLGEVNGLKVFTGIGHGGQFVLCVPSLNMIVAVQSYPDSDWATADVQERGVLNIIANYILPAAL
ncbi:MAG TPA: serine hydrolase [Melioribacteraceae bacterium]|nr:serine hydrolase [Melioribacteraceae bacterium]